MDHPALPWLATLFFAAVAAHFVIERAARRFRARRRLARASRGERDAERLLRRQGYRILERQTEARARYEVNGEAHEATVRADAIVSRGGQRFVAEVKTGEEAPSLRSRHTRRQLLEYRTAFDVDGVLLVRPEDGQVSEVRFPGLEPPRSRGNRILLFVLGMALGALATLLLLGR